MKKKTVVVLSVLAVVLIAAVLVLFVPFNSSIAAHLGIASVTEEDVVCLEITRNDAGNLTVWRTEDAELIGKMLRFTQKRRLVKFPSLYAGGSYEVSIVLNEELYERRAAFYLNPGPTEVTIRTENDGHVEGRILLGGWSNKQWTAFLEKCELTQVPSVLDCYGEGDLTAADVESVRIQLHLAEYSAYETKDPANIAMLLEHLSELKVLRGSGDEVLEPGGYRYVVIQLKNAQPGEEPLRIALWEKGISLWGADYTRISGENWTDAEWDAFLAKCELVVAP